mmetsp:Transcript_14684/g.22819  ORF Transcript_14684/g.22819 Transcript_14684/m.22819 type:complete len:207 (-) Transcript_14684:321-941(-)
MSIQILPLLPLSHVKYLTVEVLRWAEDHVIRLGLCPFAAAVMDSMSIIVRSDVIDEESALQLFLEQANRIMETPEEELPTTILALPNLFPEFEDWNDFTTALEEDLDEGGALEEVGEHVLIAAFHPDFSFAGLAAEEKVLNYEKRAPIPVINLLRTQAIDRGIEKGVDAASIADHNEEALLEEGLEQVAETFASLSDSEPPGQPDA